MKIVQAAPYPVERLDGCRSALLLFGAGFCGQNDGVYVRAAELPFVTVVDTDRAALETMRDEFPAHWVFLHVDAFRYAEFYDGGRWDFVSADVPSNLPVEMVDAIPLWCRIADRVVVSTLMRHNFPGRVGLDDLPDAPDGWRYADLIERSAYRGGAYWLVIERVE